MIPTLPAAILTTIVLLGCVVIPVAAILFAAASAARTTSEDRADLQTWLVAARADQAVRAAVLGTPTRERPIVVPAPRRAPGRHRPGTTNPLLPAEPPQPTARERTTLTAPGVTLDQAIAFLTTTRVRHEARSTDFRAIMARFA